MRILMKGKTVEESLTAWCTQCLRHVPLVKFHTCNGRLKLGPQPWRGGVYGQRETRGGR